MSGSDPVDTRSYWQRFGGLDFALPHCDDCDRFHFYPRPACPFCGSTRIAPRAASGRGRIYSYSVVHRAPSARFADQVPYVVALVSTEEGPHLMTRIVGIGPDEVRIDMAVRVVRSVDAVEPAFEPVPIKENA